MTAHWRELGRTVTPEPAQSDDRELAFITHPLALLRDEDKAELNEGLEEISRRRREVETDAPMRRRM